MRNGRRRFAGKSRGTSSKGDLQLCVVTHRLDSLWTFLQIPYLTNATAAKLNRSWDTTWFTWVKAGHAQLGPECEVIPGAQQIVPMVCVRSNRVHAPWPDQTKADYPAVALWLFTRDYRAYREGVPGALKPSLLGILTSTDFLAYLANCLDYGYKHFMRPPRPPYTCMLPGRSAPLKRRPGSASPTWMTTMTTMTTEAAAVAEVAAAAAAAAAPLTAGCGHRRSQRRSRRRSPRRRTTALAAAAAAEAAAAAMTTANRRRRSAKMTPSRFQEDHRRLGLAGHAVSSLGGPR